MTCACDLPPSLKATLSFEQAVAFLSQHRFDDSGRATHFPIAYMCAISKLGEYRDRLMDGISFFHFDGSERSPTRNWTFHWNISL